MSSSKLFRALTAAILVFGAWTGVADAQAPSGPVVMRSENSAVLQWWIVDPESGIAAFYGGDIVAICEAEPDAHDLLDLQEVQNPEDVVYVAPGEGIGTSLWDRAPVFRVPGLCEDLLTRDGPMATGTADLMFTGRFPETWGDPSTYGMAARASMLTPEGDTLRVNAHYRCRWDGDSQRCTQGVVVK